MAILHTHRRGIYLLERARVHLADGRVVYSDAEGESGLTRSWNIPSLNSVAVLLGQGSSITQPAARKLADDNVLVAFVGSGGLPLVCASQEYRPTEYLHRWLAGWQSPEWRLAAAKKLALLRVASIEKAWARYRADGFLGDPSAALSRFRDRIPSAADQAALMGAEGECSKALYKEASRAVRITWTEREHGGKDPANAFLDHGNYLAYGVASTILWVLGIPPALAVCHGRTTAGGLTFDLADVVKDAVVLPTAFQCAAEPDMSPARYRERLVTRLHDATMLDPNGCLGVCHAAMMSLLEADSPADCGRTP